MIDVNHLTYRYPATDKPALEDLSLFVQAGETVGVVGENGSGKSTLCYAMMGLVPHFYKGTYAGDVTVDGLLVRSATLGDIVQHAAMVFQNPMNQFSGAKLTVEDEIAFGMENLGMARETMVERIEWVTKLLSIEHLKSRNPLELSGGQMQRVAIASVLALRPKVLILDEPTSQLDPAGTADVFEAIKTLQNEGMTTVVVEHNIELLVEYCHRICILKSGQTIGIDEPSRLFSSRDKDWGIDIPRYSQGYQQLFPSETDVPVTLSDTSERLNRYARR